MPGSGKLVVRVAMPPLRVLPVPMVTPLLLKVTVPVGVPVVACTVAVSDGVGVDGDRVDRAGEGGGGGVEDDLGERRRGGGLGVGVAGVDRGEGVVAGGGEADGEGWRCYR